MNQYNTINKKDNKLLYVIDTGLDKFVMFIIALARVLVPAKYKAKFDKLTEHKDMLHNVVGLAFFNALSGFCVMATQVKLANYFGAAIYGIYSYCLAIGEVGVRVVIYGRNKTMVRDLIQFPEKRDTLVVSTFFLSLTNLCLFLAAVFLFHDSLDIKVDWTYFLLILAPCLGGLTLGPVYQSLRMMGWSSIYSLLRKSTILFAIWGLFFLRIEVSLFTVGVISVFALLLIILFEFYEVSTQLHIFFFQKVKLREMWDLYKSNFLIFLSGITGVAFGPLLRVILNNYTDSRTVGIYAAGLQVYHICLFLNTQISVVGNPMMAEAGKKDCPVRKRRKLVFRYSAIMLATSLPFSLPMLLFPGMVTSFLFTEEYAPLANYLPILALYMLTIAIGLVFEQYMISLRMDKTYFSIYVTSAISTVAVAYLLIPAYGLLGAFLAFCIPHGIGCICYMLSSLKSLKE